jgi:HEAT repeat protein
MARRRVAVIVLFGVLLLGSIWQFSHQRELMYEGKPLQHYLDELANHYPPKSGDDPNIRAIYAMGPDAIPHLRRAFQKKNSARLKISAFLRPRLPNVIARRLPDPKLQYFQSLSGASAHGLATFGPLAKASMPELIEGLNDPTTANMAIYAILEIGPAKKDLPAFLDLLKSTNRWAPNYAFTCIGRIAIATPEVIAALTNGAATQSLYSRTAAINALGELGPKAKSVTNVLIQNLSDPDAAIRIASAGALWKIQKDTNAAVAWLTKALNDELNQPPSNRPNVLNSREMNLMRIAALLKEAGKEAQSAIPLLREIRKEKDIRLRMNAAEALWKISGENSGVGVWLEAITHSDPNVRVYAARMLCEFCSETQWVSPEIELMLKSQDSFVRFFAARAVWKVKRQSERTLPEILAGLNDHFTYYQNAQIRQAAAETLGEMGARAESAIPALQGALTDGVAAVRSAATNALIRIDPEFAARSK